MLRDLIAGELASRRNPADLLRAMLVAPAPSRTVERWAERFLGSRIDIDTNTTRNYRTALKKAGETFGNRNPATITVDEVAAWVSELAGKARARNGAAIPRRVPAPPRLRRPRAEPGARPPGEAAEAGTRGAEPAHGGAVPSDSGRDGERWRLLFITVEQGALRLGEAVGLRWADVDAANVRLRLPRSATKRDKARWIYLPDWLIAAIEETCPLEDRVPERKVFGGISEASAYQAMTRACTLAKTGHFHPHDLRHRRLTIWHQAGVLAERAGHSRPSMTLDVYSHVIRPMMSLPSGFRPLSSPRTLWWCGPGAVSRPASGPLTRITTRTVD